MVTYYIYTACRNTNNISYVCTVLNPQKVSPCGVMFCDLFMSSSGFKLQIDSLCHPFSIYVNTVTIY